MANIVESNGPLLETVIADTQLNVVVAVPESTVITTGTADTITTNIETTQVVVSGGSQGPPGPPGASGEEDMPYAKQTDFVGDDVIYKGEAAVGSSFSAAVWRIKKLVIGVDGDVSEKWASGNANFDKVWDDRISLTYI